MTDTKSQTPAPKRRAAAKKQAGTTNAAKKAVSKAGPAPRKMPKALADARAQMAKKRKPSVRNKQTIHAIFAGLHAANPDPKGELDYVNPFTLLVAVVLSAQATDTGVNRATSPLFAVAETPEKMLALGEETVRDYIKTIGLYRTKAKNVIGLCEMLIAEHGSAVPQSREELEKLPGVGRKTANVVLNMAFGHETIAVDTHLFRLANRLRLAPGKTPLEVELGLEKVVPKEFRRHAHHWLILHGRYICKATKPECEKCVIAEFCDSADKRI
ncbi:MAG: endonuclease III [Beijerinckiaceae bacterium]|jgi:endonuclease III|nr:endonuclease III [Beijerinckiaceae bacterium]